VALLTLRLDEVGFRPAGAIPASWPGSLPRLFLALWLTVSIGFQAQGQPISTSLEQKVKAAYLFNFTKYVEWPPKAFSRAADPILIGVLGVDPLGPLLEETIGDRQVGGRKVQIKRSRKAQDLRSCHMVLISSSERSRLAEIFRELGGTFALTVSDIPQFSGNSGMITFVLENETVRFDINLENAQRAGLKINARLLNTARNVLPRRPRGSK